MFCFPLDKISSLSYDSILWYVNFCVSFYNFSQMESFCVLILPLIQYQHMGPKLFSVLKLYLIQSFLALLLHLDVPFSAYNCKTACAHQMAS